MAAPIRSCRARRCAARGRRGRKWWRNEALAEALLVRLLLLREEGAGKRRADDRDDDARDDGEEEEGELFVAQEEADEIVVAVGQAGMGQPVLDHLRAVENPVQDVRRVKPQRDQHRQCEQKGDDERDGCGRDASEQNSHELPLVFPVPRRVPRRASNQPNMARA
mgnify:CR=1 FL=1